MPWVFVAPFRIENCCTPYTQSSPSAPHGLAILQLSTCDTAVAFDLCIVWAVYHEEALIGFFQCLSLSSTLSIISRNSLQASRINISVLFWVCVCVCSRGVHRFGFIFSTEVHLCLMLSHWWWSELCFQYTIFMLDESGPQLKVVCVLEQGLLKGLAICVMYLIMYYPLTPFG